MILTQSTLDKQKCASPSCYHNYGDEPLLFYARCHPEVPPEVAYHKGGVLVITCRTCDKRVAEIAVAP